LGSLNERERVRTSSERVRIITDDYPRARTRAGGQDRARKSAIEAGGQHGRGPAHMFNGQRTRSTASTHVQRPAHTINSQRTRSMVGQQERAARAGAARKNEREPPARMGSRQERATGKTERGANTGWGRPASKNAVEQIEQGRPGAGAGASEQEQVGLSRSA
jgi:hypothetical protein